MANTQSQSQSQSPVKKEGNLEKKSRYLGIWRKRWTVLKSSSEAHQHYLSTYREERRYRCPTEHIRIDSDTDIAAHTDEKNDRIMFFVENKHDRERFIFTTQSTDERDEWMRRLTNATHSLKEPAISNGMAIESLPNIVIEPKDWLPHSQIMDQAPKMDDTDTKQEIDPNEKANDDDILREEIEPPQQIEDIQQVPLTNIAPPKMSAAVPDAVTEDEDDETEEREEEPDEEQEIRSDDNTEANALQQQTETIVPQNMDKAPEMNATDTDIKEEIDPNETDHVKDVKKEEEDEEEEADDDKKEIETEYQEIEETETVQPGIAPPKTSAAVAEVKNAVAVDIADDDEKEEYPQTPPQPVKTEPLPTQSLLKIQLSDKNIQNESPDEENDTVGNITYSPMFKPELRVHNKRDVSSDDESQDASQASSFMSDGAAPFGDRWGGSWMSDTGSARNAELDVEELEREKEKGKEKEEEREQEAQDN